MFIDPTGTLSVSLPPGWAFDPASSSLSDLVFLDWAAPKERQIFTKVRSSHVDAGASDDRWEAQVRAHLPDTLTRAERRDPTHMLVEVLGREGRAAQRWMIVRGARFDTIVEQVGVPAGGALATSELAEALRTLDVPANRRLGALRSQEEFQAEMQLAHRAFQADDFAQAARRLADARTIAREIWIHSLVGRPVPEVPAAIADAEACLALARVTGSALFLQQATLTLYRCRATLPDILAASAAAHMRRVDEMLATAMQMHAEAAKEKAPGNLFAACLLRSQLLQRELRDVLGSEQSRIGGPWGALAVEEAMSAVALARRGLLRAVPPDDASTLSAKGVTDPAAQLEMLHAVFEGTALEHLVAAAGLLHAARAQAGLWPDRVMSANWVLAARRLAEISPSEVRDRSLVLAISGHAGAFVSLGDEPSVEEASHLLAERRQSSMLLETRASCARRSVSIRPGCGTRDASLRAALRSSSARSPRRSAPEPVA